MDLCGVSAVELWLGSIAVAALSLVTVVSVTGPVLGKARWGQSQQFEVTAF